MKVSAWILSAVVAVSIGSLQSFAQAPFRSNPAPQNHAQDIDPALLIKSQQAYALLKKKSPLLIDVRSREAFNVEHIAGAISYPYPIIKNTTDYPFRDKKRKMILYCGCPHHLSGLSADILKKRGYEDVKVIDEGYFGWKALKLPITVNPNAATKVSMSFGGRIMQGNNRPAVYEDVFLRHPETGQLEATRTDKQGNFRMTLHFFNTQNTDKVEFEVRDKILKTMALDGLNKPGKDNIQLTMPTQLAAR